MKKEPTENNEKPKDEELDWETFFNEDEEVWEKEKERKKRKRTFIVKIVGGIIVFSLLVNVLAIWSNVINIPALSFLSTSHRLSKDESIEKYKKTIVTIEQKNVKGTGFNIKKDGLIVTNEHVVTDAKRVAVHIKDRGTFVGKVIAKDKNLDLALVDIKSSNLPVLPLASEGEWENGERVVFIGNPLSYTTIANEGTIVGETDLKGWNVPVMMIDAPVYRGNSGSPVINKKGRVVAVIFGTLKNPTSDERVGVATPIQHLNEIIKVEK